MPPPSRLKTVVYIDGFNLHYRLLKRMSMQWLDLYLFFTKLRSDDYITQIKYFTAPMLGSQRLGQDAYLAAIQTRPNVEVIWGKYQTQYTECAVKGCTFQGDRRFFQYKEKRTDVNIALHMARDAFENTCDQMVLVSGDSDLVPAVELARQWGKRVVLYVPTFVAAEEEKYGANELRKVATMAKNLPDTNLSKAQFLDPIPDGKGGVVPKHPSW